MFWVGGGGRLPHLLAEHPHAEQLGHERTIHLPQESAHLRGQEEGEGGTGGCSKLQTSPASGLPLLGLIRCVCGGLYCLFGCSGPKGVLGVWPGSVMGYLQARLTGEDGLSHPGGPDEGRECEEGSPEPGLMEVGGWALRSELVP